MKEIKEELDALINPGRRFSDPDNARFAKGLRKQREHIFTFLNRQSVDAMNNRAEQATQNDKQWYLRCGQAGRATT